MEAVMMHGSFDQATSPYKSHLRNPKKIHRNHPIISNFSSGGGLLQPPPFLSQSYPPQPPLLPLPTGRSSWKASNRSSSLMTAKKSKSPKKEEKKSTKKKVVASYRIIDSDARKTDYMFSGAAVFTISPPPSSLPLPTFLCCKAEATGGVDAGATNDLRRLLRLHAVNQ